MKKRLLSIFTLFLLAACSAQSADSLPLSSKVSAERPLPFVAVSGSDIKINGKTVWFGDTLVNWKRALGGAPACYDEGIIICVWHAHGLSLGTDDRDKTRVKFMTLNLTIEPAAPGERTASWPQSPFRGSLELDGIAIDSTTIFRNVLRQAPPARELRCGDRGCGNPIAAFSDGANIHMALVRRSENSPILQFSISCTSTSACVKLIPEKAEK